MRTDLQREARESPADGRTAHLRQLPQDTQRLINLMGTIGWGRIENLPVHSGSPRLTRSVKVFRRLRIEHLDEKPLRPPVQISQLKKHHLQMLDQFHQLGNGLVCRIEIQDGLPVKVEVPG